MDELKAKAEALGIKVDARWSEATLREKIAEASPSPEPQPERRLQVRLLKNYRPLNDKTYKVIGDPVPPPFHGVGKADKLWEGTVVELPADEAIRLLENVVQTRETDVDADGNAVVDGRGRPRTRVVAKRKPLAERADDYSYVA